MRRSVLFVLSIALTLPACSLSQAPSRQQPDAPERELAEAEALMAKSDWKGAEGLLSSWLSAHTTDARALFDAGFVADAQDHAEAAADDYRRALAADPALLEARLSLGLLLARQGRTAEARPELAAATQVENPNANRALKARAWRALAHIDRTANPADASNELIEALKLSPETPEDTLLAAELAEASHELDAAEKAYRRLLARDPKSEAANAGLAHILIARKQYPEAEELLRAALKQAPDNPTFTAQLATVLVAEDKAEALPLLQKLHDTHPEDAAIARMLADVEAEAGDLHGSDTLYMKLLAADPRNADLLVAHGQNLIRQQKFAEALQAFESATRLAPENADGWSGLAFAASKTGQPSIALHALTMRSKYLPENPSSYFLWATSYDMLQHRSAAIAYYHHFLEAAAGKFPDQEWQARHRLLLLEKK